MAFNVGLNVVEVDGLGAPAIQGAATSVGAFNIITQRGVPNRPVRITEFKKFTERYGSYFAGGLGAYLVDGFFKNGGQNVYVNRIVANNAQPASIMLRDAGPADTLSVDAGYRGNEDPGTWGNDLYLRVEASSGAASRIQETAAASIQSANPLPAATDLTGGTTLTIVIDGAAAATAIDIVAGDFPDPANATSAQIRDAINSHTSDLVASLANTGELVLTSTGSIATLRQDTNTATTNGWTGLQVTVANATLGFAVMAAPQMGTPAARAVNQTRLAQVDGFKVGDAVRITDGAQSAFAKLVRVVPLTGLIEWTPNIANIAAYTPFQMVVSTVEFDLAVAKGGTDAEDILETWTGLSMETDVSNYAPAVINDEIKGSKYITVTNEASGNGVGVDVPAAQAFTRFDPGLDGVPTINDFVGNSAQRTGFYAFDPYDVQLVCCERSDPAIITGALGYCAGRADCMFIGAVPEGYVAAGQATAFGQAFQGKKVYGALYGPYIKILDPIGVGANPVKFIPPVGHIAGVYARIETARGIHKAPAGDEANVVGALDVAYRLSDAEHTDLVKNGGVNGVRAVPGVGIVVDASRTLSTDTRWLYVNVRLLFNYVKSSLRQGLTWVRQEPNTDRLWSLVKYNSVTPFLKGLWRQGAFGAGAPAEVFTVICDASNNPPAEVDQGNFRVEIYFYPSKPAETIIIIVGQQPSGGSAAEA